MAVREFDESEGVVSPPTRAQRYRGVRIVKTLECFSTVKPLVKAGFPLLHLAKRIQEEWGERKDLEVNELTMALKFYQDSLDETAAALAPTVVKASKHLSTGMDALSELEWLWFLQKERIQVETESELNVGKLFPRTHLEMTVGLKVLDRYVQLRQGLGLDHLNLGTVEHTVEVRAEKVALEMGEPIARVMSNPYRRQRVLTAADQIFHLLKREGDEGEEEPASLSQKEIIDVSSSYNSSQDGYTED